MGVPDTEGDNRGVGFRGGQWGCRIRRGTMRAPDTEGDNRGVGP